MKTLALALTSLLAPATLFATVLTVSNETGYPAQYSNLQSAHDAAAGGDTLYVTPSATNYGSLTVDRAITVIGGGYGNAGANSNMDQVLCWDGSSGSGFIGLSINLFYVNGPSGNSDLLVERCLVSNVANYYGTPIDGLIIKHSILNSVSLASNFTNVLITNNVIRAQVTGSTSPSVLISNNVFTNTGSYTLVSIQYAVVSNNIFYGSAPSYDGGGVENCAFNNNLSYQTTDDDLPPTGSNVGSGNFVGQDPLFVNVPDLQGLPSYDYHLQAASPGNNGGTDGTDIGLYGGSAPLNVALDGVPRLPKVTQFDLLNSSIGQGGSINVQVQGSKHD